MGVLKSLTIKISVHICADPETFSGGMGEGVQLQTRLGPASDQGGSEKVLPFQNPYP